MRNVVVVLLFSCLLSWHVAYAEDRYFAFMPALDAASKSIKLKPVNDGEDGSLRVLVEAFRVAFPGKGEFETTSDYETRLTKFKVTEIVPAIKGGDRIAIIIPADSKIWTYDADKQELSLDYKVARYAGCFVNAASQALSYFAPQSAMARFTLYKPVDELLATPSTYEGANSFGARATVIKQVRTLWAVAVDRERPYPMARNVPPFPAIPLSPSDAQVLKGRLQIVLIGTVNLKMPVITDAQHAEPTIKHPIDETRVTYILNFQPEDALLIRPDTGAVLLRASVSAGNDVFSPIGAGPAPTVNVRKN